MRRPDGMKIPRGTVASPGATGSQLSVLECHPHPRILVVDDDPQIRGVLLPLLSRFKGSVVQAASAEEALAALRETPPDLEIADRVAGLCARQRALAAGYQAHIAKPFDAEELTTRLQSLLQLKAFTDTLEEAEKVIVALARTIDARDPYTAGHSERVSIYAGALGRQIGMPEAELTALRQGCLFHDLGKIAIRDEVLLKPGPLTPEEYEEMKRHTVLGRDLLQPMKTLARALPVVYHHHERFDGSGYPEGLSGETIPRIARAAAIADAFDGMTSDRPYRDGLFGREALDALENETRAGLWDQALVEEFRGVMETLPRRGRRGAAA